MKLYIQYFILALVFQMQNIVTSLFASFSFVPNVQELFLVYVCILLISKTSYPKTIFLLWQVIYLIHFSFISFFGREIMPSDIYLFFTHLSDTYETFVGTMEIYIASFSIFLIMLAMILLFDFKKVKINLYILLGLLVLGVFFLPIKLQDSSLSLIKSTININPTCRDIKEIKSSKKLIPKREPTVNIVLVIGESMRAKEYQSQNYEMFENYFYKSIYSGATSTDVSLPLLINGAKKPSEIDMASNIFTLAKQNKIETSFISVQSKKSMKYIKPYLHVEGINNYNIIGSRDDKDLLYELKKINFKNKTKLVVMQMQGEHSPYKYYPNYDKESDISSRYAHSMNYSNKIIVQMIEHMKSVNTNSILIFTSDHGELLGEAGRYGHNTFKEEVYRVPFIYADSSASMDTKVLNPKSISSYSLTADIESHHDIYKLIFHLLGYDSKQKNKDKKIRVNGSMINEEDGYKIFD